MPASPETNGISSPARPLIATPSRPRAKDPSRADEPFILHNVDVVSTIDLSRVLQFHRDRNALATLAVQDRKTSRYLLFDEQDRLCGRKAGDKDAEVARSSQSPMALAFAGMHVISPRIFSVLTEDGVFSIIDSYLRLSAGGEKILAFRANEYYWRDLGRPESITAAEKDLASKAFS